MLVQYTFTQSKLHVAQINHDSLPAFFLYAWRNNAARFFGGGRFWPRSGRWRGLFQRNFYIEKTQHHENAFKRGGRWIGFKVGVALLGDPELFGHGCLSQPFFLAKTLEEQRELAECLDGINHFFLRAGVAQQYTLRAVIIINSPVSVYYIYKWWCVNAANKTPSEFPASSPRSFMVRRGKIRYE